MDGNETLDRGKEQENKLFGQTPQAYFPLAGSENFMDRH